MASSGQQIPFSKEVKQAHIRNPRLIEDALRSISQDQVEEEQTLDYITDLEMRRDLLREIQAFQKANYHLPPINCAAFAILMVAPIRHLRTIWDNLKTGPDPQGRMQAWVQDLLRSPDAIRDCTSQLSDLLGLVLTHFPFFSCGTRGSNARRSSTWANWCRRSQCCRCKEGMPPKWRNRVPLADMEAIDSAKTGTTIGVSSPAHPTLRQRTFSPTPP